jgi:hypothetical protein
MTTELALEYIKRRTAELCYGNDYTMRVRHLVLQPTERRLLNAINQLFILIEPYCDIRIESGVGVFDVSEDNVNELQYEHKGDIAITNNSIFTTHVRFIQVIPKMDKTKCQ